MGRFPVLAAVALPCLAILATAISPAVAADPAEVDVWLDEEIRALVGIYEGLHARPELSFQERETARFVAKTLLAEGLEVTEGVGKYDVERRTPHGVVGVLRNGDGPTVLVRTDLDALPIVEETGLSCASRVRATDEKGSEVGVMHACGHDLHMTCFLGTARYLARNRDRWNGTLVFVGQPAEERGAGARSLLADRLYERFPRPDYALALHSSGSIEAGAVGVCPGYALASVDSVDILIRGRGGHGAYPHTTLDPIVTASRLVVSLQTLVSRTVSPLDPAVVTVGSFHGGTKHNVIPDEARLQITVRCYRREVRDTLIDGIRRITRGVVLSAGIPPENAVVRVSEEERVESTWNDPDFTRRVADAFRASLGADRVLDAEPVMAGEDFGRYSLEGHRIPSCMFWLGVVSKEAMRRHREEGMPLPSLHSSRFAPDAEPAIRTGVTAMTAAVIEILGK